MGKTRNQRGLTCESSLHGTTALIWIQIGIGLQNSYHFLKIWLFGLCECNSCLFEELSLPDGEVIRWLDSQELDTSGDLEREDRRPPDMSTLLEAKISTLLRAKISTRTSQDVGTLWRVKLFIQETLNKVKIVDLKLVSPSDSQKCNVGANNISCEAYLNNWHFFPNIFLAWWLCSKSKNNTRKKKAHCQRSVGVGSRTEWAVSRSICWTQWQRRVGSCVPSREAREASFLCQFSRRAPLNLRRQIEKEETKRVFDFTSLVRALWL